MHVVKTESPTEPLTISFNTWAGKKARLQEMFSDLTEEDLHFVEGQENLLIMRLQQKLRMSEMEVHELINGI